jgi:hypothetical protein
MEEYLFFYDGEPMFGTVEDYAKAIEHAYYTWDALSLYVFKVSQASSDDKSFESEAIYPFRTLDGESDDFAYYIVSIGDESASYRIDLRA